MREFTLQQHFSVEDKIGDSEQRELNLSVKISENNIAQKKIENLLENIMYEFASTVLDENETVFDNSIEEEMGWEL